MNRAGRGVRRRLRRRRERAEEDESGSGKKWKSVVESAKERWMAAGKCLTLAHASPGRSPAFSTVVKCWLGA